MAIPVPSPIGAAPPVPSSLDPEATFDAQYEAFNTFEREVLVPGINAHTTNVHANAQAAAQSAIDAGTAKGAAEQAAQDAAQSAQAASIAAGASSWVSGAAYAIDEVVWGTVNQGVLYRCIVAHSGVATPPDSDAVHWVSVGVRVTISPTTGPSNTVLARNPDGSLSTVTETIDGKNAVTTLTRSGGLLSQVVITYDGKTRTETFNRNPDGSLASVTATET